MTFESPLITGMADYMRRKHEGQERETVALWNAQPHDYFVHPLEVMRRFIFIIERARLMTGTLFQDIDMEMEQVKALCHDLFEDCRSDLCQENCQRLPACLPGKACTLLVQEMRKELLQWGAGEDRAESIIRGILNASKPKHLPRGERDIALYHKLSRLSFPAKIRKIADQWHNLSTLSGFTPQKAMQYYLKVRKSWPVIFSEDELKILYQAGFLESPARLVQRTALMEMLYQNWVEGRMGPADEKHFLHQELAEMRREGLWVSPSVIQWPPEEQIEMLCLRYRNMRPVLPACAEEQMRVVLLKTPQNRLRLLHQELEFGYESALRNVVTLLSRDRRIGRGNSSLRVYDEGVLDRTKIFLDTLGMTGEEFLHINSEYEFIQIVGQKIGQLTQNE